MKNTLITLVSVAALAGAANAQTNLLTNGGFETGDLTGWTGNATVNASGAFGLSTNSGGFLLNPDSPQTDPTQSFILNSAATVSFGGSVALQVGPHDIVADVATFQILDNTSTLVAQVGGPVTPILNDYVDYSGNVSLGAGTYTFAITGWSNNVSIDDAFVTVTIPEPSSTALLGLGSLGLLARRKR